MPNPAAADTRIVLSFANCSQALFDAAAPDDSAKYGCPPYNYRFAAGQCLMAFVHPYTFKVRLPARAHLLPAASVAAAFVPTDWPQTCTPGKLHHTRTHMVCVRGICICLDTSGGPEPNYRAYQMSRSTKAREHDICTIKHNEKALQHRASETYGIDA